MGIAHLRGGIVAAAACALAGCSTISAMNPVNWWHKQEGGKIAQERPAPPGADAPYPNLATVPAKPEPPDAEALKKLTDSLVADRTNAQHAAQSVPLADPSQPSTSPGLFGVGTAPPPPPPGSAPSVPAPSSPPASGGAASASMPAVTAPPAPAPRKAVTSAPLEAPATPAAAPPPAPQPELPPAPPPRPAAAGAPRPEPVVPAAMPAPSAAAAASVVFVEGASSLAPPAADEVKAFAAKRGNGVIVVTGYGDSPASDPAAQSAALTLALSRARSVSEVLKSAGVPAEAIRLGAEASGRGASLRLVQ